MNKTARYISVMMVLIGAGWWWVGRDDYRKHMPEIGARIVVNEILVKSLERFKIHIGRYPTTFEGLDALMTCPVGLEAVWKGPYIDPKTVFRNGSPTGTLEYNMPSDSWGLNYLYRCPGIRSSAGFDVWSLGPDRIISADDIGNWRD